jgi:hypothetical protein
MCILLKGQLQSELKDAIKLLTFLKRQRGHRKQVRGRFINIVLVSMQIITNILTFFTMLLTICQEPSFKMCVKSFMSLAFLSTIDNMFASGMPNDVKENT